MTEEQDLQTLTLSLENNSARTETGVSQLREEIAFRKGRLADLARLVESQNRVANLEKRLMYLGDPVKDTGGYKIRQKVISASIFKHRDRRKIIKISLILGCIALSFYGLSFLLPRTVMWGDTVRINYAIYTPELQLLEESPPAGVVYTLTKDLKPRLFFEGIVGRPVGSNFWIDIPACDSHDCPNYGGFTGGSFAWRELRINITIIELLIPAP